MACVLALIAIPQAERTTGPGIRVESIGISAIMTAIKSGANETASTPIRQLAEEHRNRAVPRSLTGPPEQT